jgi:pullulanase
VADPGWVAETTFGAASGDELASLDSPKTLTITDNQNINFSVSEDGAFDLFLDVSDPTMPVLTISDAAPFMLGTKLYLRGSFNGWGNDSDDNFALTDVDAFHYADGVYTSTISLAAADSPHFFKVASSGWEDNTSFGGLADATEVTVDSAGIKELFVSQEDGTENLSITLTEDANLQFTLDVSDQEAPQLKVISTPLAGAIYLRGSMNGWANDADGNFSLESGTKVLRYQGGNIYTAEVALEADSHGFKIADPGWAAETTFGAVTGDEEVTLSESKVLTITDSQNIQFTNAEASTYMLSLDVTDPMAPTLILADQAPFGSQSIYLRGSIYGWDNPSDSPFTYQGAGIYSINVDLEVGDNSFKVAGDDWDTTTFDYGAPLDDVTVVEGEAKTMLLSEGEGTNANLTIGVTEAATHTFTVDLNDTVSPSMTVTK